MPDKHTRRLALLRKARDLARRCKWREPFDELPAETRKAFLTDGSKRISKRDDRKRFAKYVYGHKTGYFWTHLDPRSLRDRATIRDADAEIEELTR